MANPVNPTYICSACMYYDTGFCRRWAPQLMPGNNPSPWAWPKVDPTLGWCGDGKKATSGAPYTSGPVATGTFTINGLNYTVTDANCNASSAVQSWVTNLISGFFTGFNIAPANGSFTVWNAGGGAVNADCAYTITNGAP